MNRYFFNASQSPAREFCYIAQFLVSLVLSNVLVTVDILFCGLCLYIVAMYKDLQTTLRCIDQNANAINIENVHERRQNVRDCIEFHLETIR